MSPMPMKKQKIKSFESRLKSGEIIDIRAMADRTGYSEQHLRRLCHAKKIAHLSRDPKKLEPIVRGGKQFFFIAESVDDVLKHIKAVKA